MPAPALRLFYDLSEGSKLHFRFDLDRSIFFVERYQLNIIFVLLIFFNISVTVQKEVQRVDKAAIQELRGKDVILVFPEESKKNKTVRVLKLPKTESSIRKVFLPKSVAEMLVE